MLPTASQTTGANGLKYFPNTHGWPGSVLRKKINITPGHSQSAFIFELVGIPVSGLILCVQHFILCYPPLFPVSCLIFPDSGNLIFCL